MLESFDCSVVAERGDSSDLAGVVSECRPDVLVVEFGMTPIDGAEVARTVRDELPSTPVVVLDSSLDEMHAVKSLQSGAAAYVSKHADPRELPEAIAAAIKGENYVSSPLSRRPIDYWLKRPARADVDAYETLTAREREVLRLVGEGLSSPTIARRLGISRRTVEAHRANVKRKLKLRDHPAVLRYALLRQLRRQTI